MADSSQDRWRRRRYADLVRETEEGERVASGHHHSASSEDTEDYYNRYSASSCESDRTLSDCDATATSAAAATASDNFCKSSATSAAAANSNKDCDSSVTSVAASSSKKDNAAPSHGVAAALPLEACRICGKEFISRMAVCGHMKVHAVEKGNGKEKAVEINVAVKKGWGVTGRRGCSGSGSRGASPDAEAEAEADHSMAIVIAEPGVVLQPTPLAYAVTNASTVQPMAPARHDPSAEGSSAQPIVHNAATAIVVAGADPHTEAAVHQPAAPPPAEEQQAAAQLVHQQLAVPPPAGEQDEDGYRCKVCTKWFATHQGLGGHVAGHKNRQNGTPCRRGSKPAKLHVCEQCGKEFQTGVQLGGHKRKHYNGPPIVPKKKKPRVTQPVPPPADVPGPAAPDPADARMTDLKLALPVKAEEQSLAPTVKEEMPSLAPAMEAVQPAMATAVERTPEAAPGTAAVVGRVLLFGCDIGAGGQTSTVQEGSLETEDSPCTGGMQ
ncbi:hypothetical protein ACP70R_037994 [Stipagrostis hirtigluma subsp. patula]